MIALWGYAVAALVVAGQLLVTRRAPGPVRRASSSASRAALTILTWIATALVPLSIQVFERAGGQTNRAQSEVVVVEAAGQRIIEDGTPYLTRAAIAALPANEQVLGYTPYHPGMAVFGMPRALGGAVWWADARIWFALVTIAALLGIVRLLLGTLRPPFIRALQAATVLPTCALPLATGGDDLPVLALCLLAFALAARGRFTATGIIVGVAGTLKLLALPIAVVLLALAAVRGRRVVMRYACGAFGVPALVLLPTALVNADAAIENVLRFPLGAGLAATPARSPLVGKLLTVWVPGGTYLALGLVTLSALALAVWLIRWPPNDPAAAALICAIGLSCAIGFLPSSRFGYLLYPVAYLCFVPVLRPPSTRNGESFVRLSQNASPVDVFQCSK